MKENNFQKKLITDIKNTFPGCIVLKNDARYIQGFPDLTVLYKDHWAVLECKKSEYDKNHNQQPNQDDYVRMLNDMSYSSFIYPENKNTVMEDLKNLFL